MANDLYDGTVFVDGAHERIFLDENRVMEARKLDVEFFRKTGVYTKVHKTKARRHNIITTRCVANNESVGYQDINRRSLVERELNRDKRHVLFAPSSL